MGSIGPGLIVIVVILLGAYFFRPMPVRSRRHLRIAAIVATVFALGFTVALFAAPPGNVGFVVAMWVGAAVSYWQLWRGR